jgi:hypothetical protein
MNPGDRWVFDSPFYVILDVAVCGPLIAQWCPLPDASTTFPQTLKVDYVRYYAG